MSTHVDVLSFRSLTATAPDGSIGFEAGVAFLGAVQKTVVAAAKASGDTKLPYYSRKNGGLAREYLSTARLGQTGRGSNVVEVLSLMPDEPVEAEQTLLPPAPSERPPLQRTVNLRLLEAIDALTVAADQYLESNDLDEFRHYVDVGVSAELCDAACGLLDLGADIELHLTPATEVELAEPGMSTRATLHLRHRQALREASDGLRVMSVDSDVRLTGMVTNLQRRSTADGAGTVTLRVLGDDPVAGTVKVRVGPQRYNDAMIAHRSDRSITVRGTLIRQASTHWIYSPISFLVGSGSAEVPVDDDGDADEQLPFSSDS